MLTPHRHSRILVLDKMLRAEGVRISQAASQWGVQPLRIRQDLEWLELNGAKIEHVPGTNRKVFRYTEDYRSTAPEFVE